MEYRKFFEKREEKKIFVIAFAVVIQNSVELTNIKHISYDNDSYWQWNLMQKLHLQSTLLNFDKTHKQSYRLNDTKWQKWGKWTPWNAYQHVPNECEFFFLRTWIFFLNKSDMRFQLLLEFWSFWNIRKRSFHSFKLFIHFFSPNQFSNAAESIQ